MVMVMMRIMMARTELMLVCYQPPTRQQQQKLNKAPEAGMENDG